MSSSLLDHVRGSWRILVKELAAFGVVGAVGFLVDLALFNFFFDHGQIVAKTISTTVATAVTYVGNRNLSFSHRARSKLAREAGFFFLINLIALLVALVIIAIFSYPLHYKHHVLVMNVVNLFTIGLGTIFRFWAYKRFVFLHPDRVAAGLPDRDPNDPNDWDNPDEDPETVLSAG
ncbi:GtrA family protein [Jatrophihabitans sp.]|uniref:GtrA family protein n=1 Tax=Jatrophihabitans sp. TaxID=1932789 RepID=UPI002CE1EDED|nr:GtrA family protein [Jatrophihabitans sp.]